MKQTQSKFRKLFTHPNELSAPLTSVELTGSLFGSVAMTLLFVLTSNFMSYYFTDVVGISATIVGTLMLVTRIIEAFSNMGMGMIITKTKSRFGHARAWILRMSLPLAITVLMTFSVPTSLSNNLKIIYAALTYILMTACAATAVETASSVLGASMTSHGPSREKRAIFSSIIALLAGVVGAVFIQQYTAARGDSPAAWRTVATIFAIIAFSGQMLQFLLTKDRRHSVSDSHSAVKTSFRQMLPALLQNKYFIIMYFVSFLSAIDVAMNGAQMYYFKYIFHDTSIIAIVSIVTMAANLAGILLTPILTRKFRKTPLIICGLIIKAAASGAIALMPSNLPYFIGLTALKNVAGGPMMVLSGVLLLNTIEYGEEKTGIRADSLIVTTSSFSNKIGTGLGSALIGWIMALGGFVSGLEVQPASVGTTVVFISCILPAIVTVLQVISLLFYKLDPRT